jgi:hypothetical protein
MKEVSFSEVIPKVAVFHITCHQPREPIISDANRWLDLLLAAILEASLVEDRQLEDDMARTIALVRRWEYLSIVQEHDSDTPFVALVDSELHLLVLHLHSDVTHKPYTSWIAGEIPCLSFTIPLIVRRDNCDLLAELDETNRKLIDHHSKSTDCRPSSELGRREYNISQFIALEH